MSASVQFNVRIKAEIAASLRGEAKERGILPGELLEELAEGHRAETRAGVWVELDGSIDAALRAVAAARQTTPERLLQTLVGDSARRMLVELAAELPDLDDADGYEGLLDLFSDPESAPTQRRADANLSHGERRRRPRRAPLTDAQRDELAAVPAGVPRTGAALRTWRERAGLSDEALGRRCGVSKVAIGLWEKKADLPAPILLKLARGIGDLARN